MRGLHWFRNDLRLADNRSLEALAGRVDEWAGVFVLDPALLAGGPTLPRIRFLLDTLSRLSDRMAERGIPLLIRRGRPEEVLPGLLRRLGARALSFGEAQTPFAERRDARVVAALERDGVETIRMRDHGIFGPEEIRKGDGGHYSIFTPYRNAWWKAWHASPRWAAARLRLSARPIELPRSVSKGTLPRYPETPGLPSGGEAAARRRLRLFLSRRVGRYASDRDQPAIDGTSRLSPYLRFGVISARRCFTAALSHAESHPEDVEGVGKWLDELIWREFYQMVLAHSPHVLSRSFRPEYDAIQWSGTDLQFEAWCEGRTGYPIVDAGMRQLRAHGWMHNRVRMVVASFLTKDLLIDWRRGERFFYESLVDGDPASNNGGWQWAASTGTDAQPYFRIFNPVSQGERWDPEGVYVRRFVPDLRDVPDRFVHCPWKAPSPPPAYPAPIVDHAVQRERALDAYRRARGARG